MSDRDSETAVRAANEEFYLAFDALDLERMSAVWLQEPWVRCVHPGGDLLQGWEKIRASWAEIFARVSWIRVTPTNVIVNQCAEMTLVVCTENVTATTGDHVGVSAKLATNIFKKVDGKFRMVHHHASDAPVSVTQPFSGTVQ